VGDDITFLHDQGSLTDWFGQDSLHADQGSRNESSADFHRDWLGNHDHLNKPNVIRRSPTRKRWVTPSASLCGNAPSSAVIARAGGRSSIPDKPMIKWKSRGVLDTPIARGAW